MLLKLEKKHIEPAINIALWLIILAFTFFLGQPQDGFLWQATLRNIIWLVPFLIIFIINNNILAPKFLFKKNYKSYFIVCFLLILVVSPPIITKKLHNALPEPSLSERERLNHNIPPPPFRQENNQFEFENRRPDPRFEPARPDGREPFAGRQLIPKFLSNFLLGFLVVGFNTAIKQAGKLVREERLRHELEEEKLQAELSFLKDQISPHFLMNTLNNIHALVELDPDVAQESIIKLSHMLRYLLYEKDNEKTTLSREIEFIKSYVALMKIRYSDLLDVQVTISKNMPELSVPPFVFVTIIENAFKHGALPNKPGFIHISLGLMDKELVFTCSNSKQKEIIEAKKDDRHGIGIENTRKRLSLFFDNNYKWSVCDKEDNYVSIIKIPVYET